MKNNEELNELEKRIQSLPVPDYQQNFTDETQQAIHERLIQFARSNHQKSKGRITMMKKISVGLASVAAIVLLAILTYPIIQDQLLNLNSPKQGQGSNQPTPADQPKVEQDENAQNQNQNHPDTVMYDNNEYGFTFTLPKSWEGYQIVQDSWEGLSAEGKIIENGKIILIRHPLWTKDKPRQDIPIMIFTQEQWFSLEKDEFHIGAAPIGPTKLGENNQYVFALPARYNFAFLEGYEEVETILQNNPIQVKNVTSH